MPANNVKRMTESKNHHSTTPKASADLGKHSQMTINYLYNAKVNHIDNFQVARGKT